MGSFDSDSESLTTLRRKAESLTKLEGSNYNGDLEILSPQTVRKILHELHVHQLELEMQNEELHRTREALETSYEKYYDLYDNAPAGYVTIDEDGNVLEVNATAAELFRSGNAALLKQPLTSFIHPEDQDILYLQRRKLRETGSPQTSELRLISRNASPLWVSMQLCNALHDGRDHASRAVLSDISERKLSERLKEDVERILFHDLRTPATAAIQLASLLALNPCLSEQDRSLLSELENSGRMMLDTLNHSLNLYKIEAGQYDCSIGDVDTLDILKEVCSKLSRMSRFARMHVRLQMNGSPPSEDASCFIKGEPFLLSMAFMNLLQNALEASPPEKTVTVNLRVNGGCQIEIRNFGVVPADIRDRFFEKFVTAGKKSGIGIGTYSAWKMIELLKGSIDMHTSDEKNETVVTIRLPG